MKFEFVMVALFEVFVKLKKTCLYNDDFKRVHSGAHLNYFEFFFSHGMKMFFLVWVFLRCPNMILDSSRQPAVRETPKTREVRAVCWNNIGAHFLIWSALKENHHYITMIFFRCIPDGIFTTFIISEFWSQTAVFLSFLILSRVFAQLYCERTPHFWRDLVNSFSEWYKTSLCYIWSWNGSHLISRKYCDFVK